MRGVQSFHSSHLLLLYGERDSRVFTIFYCCHGRSYDECGGFYSPFFSFIHLFYLVGVFLGPAIKSMVMEDTLEVIEFILGEDLMKIQEYVIPDRSGLRCWDLPRG